MHLNSKIKTSKDAFVLGGGCPAGTGQGSNTGHQRLRVMVIEDSEIIRQRLTEMIRQIQSIALVGCATNGVQGLAMFRMLKPDAVLLDLQMEGLHGMDLIPIFKRELPQCRVVVLTAFGDKSTRERAMQLGADFFYDKASEFDVALQTLKDLGRALRSSHMIPLSTSNEQWDVPIRTSECT